MSSEVTQKLAEDLVALSPTDYGNALSREHFTSHEIKPLWRPMPRIAGPAFTVQLASGDHLMLHAAIYEAPAGSIIVVDGVDCLNAVAGGNVCAIAKQNGIKGFIIDGVIRDLEELREMQFPVFARGVFPVPGNKAVFTPLKIDIRCAGAKVSNGDWVVADEEGIVFIPQAEVRSVYEKANARKQTEDAQSLEEWKKIHYQKVQQALDKAR